jgi:hypothetical protein
MISMWGKSIVVMALCGLFIFPHLFMMLHNILPCKNRPDTEPFSCHNGTAQIMSKYRGAVYARCTHGVRVVQSPPTRLNAVVRLSWALHDRAVFWHKFRLINTRAAYAVPFPASDDTRSQSVSPLCPFLPYLPSVSNFRTISIWLPRK